MLGNSDPKLALSSRAEHDSSPDTDPGSNFWKNAPGIFITSDSYGEEVPGHKTEVRSRWTTENLYFLFVCPFKQLNLKPDPSFSAKTWGLWNWDVAEAFIGSTSDPIYRYREFEMSPRGEWLDLDVDLHQPDKIADHSWSSGFEVAARIELEKNVWFGYMRIPYRCIEPQLAAVGNTLRINFFRSQGQDPFELAWQAPQQASFHAPERFGTLRLTH